MTAHRPAQFATPHCTERIDKPLPDRSAEWGKRGAPDTCRDCGIPIDAGMRCAECRVIAKRKKARLDQARRRAALRKQ